MKIVLKSMKWTIMARCVFLWLILASAGCITIERDGGKFLEEKDICTRSEPPSYSVRHIAAVRPVLTLANGVYELRLEADGSFVRHDESVVTCEVSGRKRVMGVGFFPALFVPHTHEFYKTGPAKRICEVIMFNIGVVGIPTICSLLIEPFREHHLVCADTTPTDWGLIGCRKYLVNIQPYRKVRRDKREQPRSTVTLTGYEAELNGRAFRPDRDGIIRFSLRSGASLRIKVSSPPYFSEDPSGEAQGLVGLEMEKTCP